MAKLLFNVGDMIIDKRFTNEKVKFKGILRIINIERFTDDNDKYFVEDMADQNRFYYMTFSLKEAMDKGIVQKFEIPKKPELKVNKEAMEDLENKEFFEKHPNHKVYNYDEKYVDHLYFKHNGYEPLILEELEKIDFGMDHSDLESVLGCYLDKSTDTDEIYRIDRWLRKLSSEGKL